MRYVAGRNGRGRLLLLFSGSRIVSSVGRSQLSSRKMEKKMSKRFLLVTTLTTIVQTRLIVPGDIAPFDISTGVTDVEAIIKSNCEYGNSLPFRILEREFSRGSVGTMYKKKKRSGKISKNTRSMLQH